MTCGGFERFSRPTWTPRAHVAGLQRHLGGATGELPELICDAAERHSAADFELLLDAARSGIRAGVDLRQTFHEMSALVRNFAFLVLATRIPVVGQGAPLRTSPSLRTQLARVGCLPRNIA